MYGIVLQVLREHFEGTTGDVKNSSIEWCARDIVAAIESRLIPLIPLALDAAGSENDGDLERTAAQVKHGR